MWRMNQGKKAAIGNVISCGWQMHYRLLCSFLVSLERIHSYDLVTNWFSRNIIPNSIFKYPISGIDHDDLHRYARPRLLVFHHLHRGEGPQPGFQELRRRPLVGRGKYLLVCIVKIEKFSDEISEESNFVSTAEDGTADMQGMLPLRCPFALTADGSIERERARLHGVRQRGKRNWNRKLTLSQISFRVAHREWDMCVTKTESRLLGKVRGQFPILWLFVLYM